MHRLSLIYGVPNVLVQCDTFCYPMIQAKVGLHEVLLETCLLVTNIVAGPLRQPSSFVKLQSDM
jgi:hypothetical protein